MFRYPNNCLFFVYISPILWRMCRNVADQFDSEMEFTNKERLQQLLMLSRSSCNSQANAITMDNILKYSGG